MEKRIIHWHHYQFDIVHENHPEKTQLIITNKKINRTRRVNILYKPLVKRWRAVDCYSAGFRSLEELAENHVIVNPELLDLSHIHFDIKMGTHVMWNHIFQEEGHSHNNFGNGIGDNSNNHGGMHEE